jgi:Caspase domain
VPVTRRQFLAAAGFTLASTHATRAAAPQPALSSRAAVGVGVDRVGGPPPLRAAASGAVAVAEWLTSEGLDITLIVDHQNPVLANDVKVAIKALVNRGTLEQLVIYFAGHGFVSASNSEFWLLSSALENPNEAVSLVESRFGIKNLVFISDACRSQAESLRTEHVRGQIVFPTPSGGSNVRCDVDKFFVVDKFFATRMGLPAWEVPVATSTANYKGIYTTCFLEAFKHPYVSMVETVDGKPVVTNRGLRDYLEQEVPKMASETSITLNQPPDAEVCCSDKWKSSRAVCAEHRPSLLETF